MRFLEKIASLRLATVCVSMGGSLLVAAPSTAAGLSGQEGDVKRKIMYGKNATGGCPSMYRAYVKASGHSAFVATHIDYFYGSHVCGNSLNAGSKSAAERAAMARCEEALRKYKGAGEQKIAGPCIIHMSK